MKANHNIQAILVIGLALMISVIGNAQQVNTDVIAESIKAEKIRCEKLKDPEYRSGAMAMIAAVEADIGKPLTVTERMRAVVTRKFRQHAAAGSTIVDHTDLDRHYKAPDQAILIRSALSSVVLILDGKKCACGKCEEHVRALVLPYGEALVDQEDQQQRKAGLANGADSIKYAIMLLTGRMKANSPPPPAVKPAPAKPTPPAGDGKKVLPVSPKKAGLVV